jgi:alpha-1,6-mannosyltransferase
MHVADVTMFYAAQSGGIRRYLQEKRRWFEARPAHRHSLVLPRGAAALGEGAIEVPSVPLPFSSGYRLPLARRPAALALEALAPDLIEAGDPYHLAWAALDAGQALGVPVVGFYHSDLPRLARKLGGLRGERLAESYVRRLYSQFDLVLAPSLCMAERLRDLGVERVRRQTLGVDTRVVRPARRDVAWRLRLGARREDRLLIFVGRFAPEKNLHELYAAMDRLGPGHLLILVGGGNPPPPRADVRVVPYIADAAQLASLIACCDAFIHAGDQETFGLAALEAMACGVPVVAARAAGLAELVDEQVGAAVFPGGRGGLGVALAEAVEELFARNLAPLRAAARRRAQQYDWSRVLPEIVAQYRRLLTCDPVRLPVRTSVPPTPLHSAG